MNDFPCKCGHRNKIHSSLEDAKKFYGHIGRMCVEYKNYPDPERSEEICKCIDFEPDNLKYLEMKYKENHK